MNTQDIIGRTVASVEQSKVDCRVQVSIRFTDGSSLVVYTEDAPRGTVSMGVWLDMEIVESLKCRAVHPPDCLCDTCICSCGHRNHDGSCRNHKRFCVGSCLLIFS